MERVADYLRGRGAAPVILDLSRFPAEPCVSLADGAVEVSGVGVGEVGSWYVRSMPLALPFLATSAPAYAAGRERRAFAAGLAATLERAGAHLVNPPAALAQHFAKLDQLQRLRDAGVPVPRTLATNDPAAVTGFAGRVGTSIVYKPLAGGGMCRRLEDRDRRPERLRLLANAPVLFQEEVPGANVRVYVVGGRVAGSYEIVSEHVDYRGTETAVLPARISSAEEDACLRSAAACSMAFTGIDLKRRPDGSFAVLELNPSPMFAAIERRTGTDAVTRALGELLVSPEPTAVG